MQSKQNLNYQHEISLYIAEIHQSDILAIKIILKR